MNTVEMYNVLRTHHKEKSSIFHECTICINVETYCVVLRNGDSEVTITKSEPTDVFNDRIQRSERDRVNYFFTEIE